MKGKNKIKEIGKRKSLEGKRKERKKNERIFERKEEIGKERKVKRKNVRMYE